MTGRDPREPTAPRNAAYTEPMFGRGGAVAGSAAAARAARPGGVFAAFAVPRYGRLWASGWTWNLTRWMAVFLGSYLVNQLTHSPFLVQLVGAAFFAPMFFAGVLGGVISDRFDRRRTILAQLLILVPVALGMGALVLNGALRVWMIYPFMLAIGIGGVIDMTSRRALVFDFVGEALVTNALALEALSMTAGTTLGSFTGGAMIAFIGLGQAFLLIALLYVVSFLLLLAVPSPVQVRRSEASVSLLREVGAGFRHLRGEPTLISLLGVTILVNLFYFSFTPLTPVFADRLHVNALLTGLLASAAGFGSMIGSFLIAARLPARRGLLYTGGAASAMLFLFLFAAVDWYPAAFLALVLAGICMSGFVTMQAALVMLTAPPAMRGRAMGLLSMAIGALPFAMLGLGLAAQWLGAPRSVMASATLGLLTMLLWSRRRPEARRLA